MQKDGKNINDENENNLYRTRRLKKHIVDNDQDAQDFIIEDEVTEDSAEQI